MTNKKKITHMLGWGKPQNFLLAFIDELWKTWKIRILVKWNKLLEISSFYTCVPKITFIWGTVAEIRSETEFFVILSHFFALMPPNNLENQNFEKMTGFNLLGCDSWSTTRFWIFMIEFFVIMSLFTKRQKPLELKMDLWHLNNMKVVLTLWTLNYVDCVPLSCLYYLHNVLSQAK